MGYPFGNDPAKVAAYRRFWAREPVDRPLAGFTLKSWFPMYEFAASRAWLGLDYLGPDMIHPEEFIEDQEKLMKEGEVTEDDVFRGAGPCEAVPWLEAMLGARLRILDESVLALDLDLSWEGLEALTLDQKSPWFQKYLEFIRVLVAASNGRYPISHVPSIVGPSDIVATLRGHSNMILDFYDAPEKLVQLFYRIESLLGEIREAQWSVTPLFQGGYFDATYQLWAPGPLVRMQEDALGLFSPKVYRRLLRPVDREWARRTPYTIMHNHSTSMFVLDDILEVEEITALQVNRDVEGPALERMIPFYRMIQDADRSLMVRGSFTARELDQMLESLTPAGLYLYIIIEDLAEIEPLRQVLNM